MSVSDTLPIESRLPGSRGDRLAQLAAADPAGLRGQVVVLDFWTYTCINWLRTLPYVRAWAEKYADLGVDGDRRPHP